VRLVMDSKAITVKPSRDLYSAVSFTDHSVYSRDQTSLMWDLCTTGLEVYSLLGLLDLMVLLSVCLVTQLNRRFYAADSSRVPVILLLLLF
jgi:hypothetical protein